MRSTNFYYVRLLGGIEWPVIKLGILGMSELGSEKIEGKMIKKLGKFDMSGDLSNFLS